MKKSGSTALSFLFPWIAPLVLKFEVEFSGFVLRAYVNNRFNNEIYESRLQRILPQPQANWLAQYINKLLLPYPQAKRLSQTLAQLKYDKLIIDDSALTTLNEIKQPDDFMLAWEINHPRERIEGHYEGIDNYLGMGWFQKGSAVWSLNREHLKKLPDAISSLIGNTIFIQLQQVDSWFNSTLPLLQSCIPNRVDFKIITDFTLQIVASAIHFGELMLTLQSNYPQLLPLPTPIQRNLDVLLTDNAIIKFSRQALTPAVQQLLLKPYGTSTTISGAQVPLFISKELPELQQHHLIQDEIAAEIKQANPIVPITTLKPTYSLTHTYENGIGTYVTTAAYQYQQQKLNMANILRTYQEKRRFTQESFIQVKDLNVIATLRTRQENQYLMQESSLWIEWPDNPGNLIATIKQQCEPQRIKADVLMGFSSQNTQLRDKMPDIHNIQITGANPIGRGQSLLDQLRYHGIPSCIVYSESDIRTIVVNACKSLVQASISHQTSILWLVPSNKKGIVSRTINGSDISRRVAVASLVTLRDMPALLTRVWDLVIFQDIDQLSDGSTESRHLPQLQWHWALATVIYKQRFNQSLMPILHLSEQYYEQFCQRYIFDLKRDYASTIRNISATAEAHVQPVEKITQPVDLPKAKEHDNMISRTQIENNAAIEFRIAVMKQYWHELDGIYARQKPGMSPLWGLVEDFRTFDFSQTIQFRAPYQARLYRQLLSPGLLTMIDRRWGTAMLPRNPGRIVSEPFPHMLFANTFGVALKFWHGCELTAWFICEGPSSRTNLAGMEQYYTKELSALQEMETPIDRRLFEDLTNAEAHLGQPQTIKLSQSSGISNIPLYGTRREGFEKLRDIITSYRRQWTNTYLGRYLFNRAEKEINAAADLYYPNSGQRVILLTARQFAANKAVTEATNHWFGGDISKLYTAIQQQSPLSPKQAATLPPDRTAFAKAVFTALSANVKPDNTTSSSSNAQDEKSRYGDQLDKLAVLSLNYIQMEEMLGATPLLKDIGTARFRQCSSILDSDIDAAWDIFTHAIEEAKKIPATLPNATKATPTRAEATAPVLERITSNLTKTEPPVSRTTTPSPQKATEKKPLPQVRRTIELNQRKIEKLQEESGQLQERLTIEEEEQTYLDFQEPVVQTREEEIQETLQDTEQDHSSSPTENEESNATPDVDEDWQVIIQKWKPEHWEIVISLHQKQDKQLQAIAARAHRPLSQLIDEINEPVDEQLEDLLVDPDTNTLTSYFYPIVENLIDWYHSSISL